MDCAVAVWSVQKTNLRIAVTVNVIEQNGVQPRFVFCFCAVGVRVDLSF
jgi:hypothetical protein